MSILKVRLVDLDRRIVGKERRDDDLRERGVATVRRVEWRLPHETVDAAFGLQHAVGVLAANRDRGGLEARLLARARLEQLVLEAPVGRPAQVHAEEHLGPVLGVGPPRSRVDLQDRIAGVVLSGEERVLLEPPELAFERVDDLGDLRAELALTEGEELLRVVVLALEALVALELPRRACVLGRDASGPGLVVPETGSAHRLLEPHLSAR